MSDDLNNWYFFWCQTSLLGGLHVNADFFRNHDKAGKDGRYCNHPNRFMMEAKTALRGCLEEATKRMMAAKQQGSSGKQRMSWTRGWPNRCPNDLTK